MTSERTRILLLVPSFVRGGGGAERVFSILPRHLDRTRFEIHLAVAQTRSSHLQDLPPDVVVHDLEISRMRYALPAIIRVARKVQPRVILSTVVHLNAMLILARFFLPRSIKMLVREATTPTAFISTQAEHPWVWRFIYKHLYRKAEKVICPSDFVLNDLAEHFGVPRDRMVRIYNPVDVANVRQLAEAGGAPYNAPGPHIVTAGRLSIEKGMDVLMDAMPAVTRRFPHAHLTILGEGPLEQSLKDQAERLGVKDAVTFVGFQSNPWPYFRYADLYVLPSRLEGLPNVVLEALALGTPVVASNCPGGVREIQNATHSVTLVPPENPAALADAIIATLSSGTPRPSVDQIAQRLAAFDVQHAVQQYSELLIPR
jgi:glycosyltransferase involved in cell wall biosynthesis